MQPKQPRSPSLFTYIRRVPTTGVLAIGIIVGLTIAQLFLKPVSNQYVCRIYYRMSCSL